MPYTYLTDFNYGGITLSDYCHIIGYDECAFWGIFYDGQIEYDCKMFWSEWQRQDIYNALVEAQLLIEEVVGYPISRKWIAGQPTEFGQQQQYVDVQALGNPTVLKWGNIISNGVRATSTIQSGASVTHTNDPATVGPIATSIGNVQEVKVYYPGTLREITPSKMTYTGGNLTIFIPRCRLVEEFNGTDTGVDYNVLSNFLTTVDVVRVYNDPSVAAVLVAPHSCTLACQSNGCSEYTTTGCIFVRDNRLSIVDILPATYSGGQWVDGSFDYCIRDYQYVRLNYLAGLEYTDAAMKSAIVRLAHARMAAEPCRCTVVQKLWERDRMVPQVLTAERLNCPFGSNEGAWTAYKFARSKRLLKMGIL